MGSVRLAELEKVYNGSGRSSDFRAVKGIDLEIEDGEFMVLVGPSGCGKSTTLRMIAGLEEVSSGTIEIDSVVINEKAPKDREIAMVFQNYALYPHMTVYQNMAFALKLGKVSKPDIDRRVREAAAILDLSALLDRKPQALSGGQRQRVAVGRAIVRDPKVFLFDEPLSNLDAKMRALMRVELMKLHEQLSSTMIYVTHDQVEAMTMGDRICVMSDGEVMQVDTPANIYDFPINRFVASFIGSPSMNFLEGRLELCKGQTTVQVTTDLVLQLEQGMFESSSSSVVVGLRPEDVELSDAIDKSACLTGSIELIETLGAETLYHVSICDFQIVVREQGRTHMRSKDVVGLRFNLKKMHLFDSKDGRSLRVNKGTL